MEPASPLSKEQIDAILEFLPIFEAEGFEFGAWDSGDGGFPSYVLSADARRFVASLYGNAVIASLDWTGWQETAARLVTDTDALQAADVEDLRRLLTTHARKERFCDGHLANMFKCGHITAVLRRLKEIRGAMD